jgi:predicted ester cyclase
MLDFDIFALSSAALALTLPLATVACEPETRGRGAPETVQQNKAVALRYFDDLWNRLDPSVADEIVAADVVGHVGSRTLHQRDALKDRVNLVRGIYERSTFRVETVVAEGDFVGVRWSQNARHNGRFLGPKTQGREVIVTGMSLFRFANGKIVEIWVNADDLSELQQLGVEVPSGV